MTSKTGVLIGSGILLLLLSVLSSCTMEKRLYRPGFHVEFDGSSSSGGHKSTRSEREEILTSQNKQETNPEPEITKTIQEEKVHPVKNVAVKEEKNKTPLVSAPITSPNSSTPTLTSPSALRTSHFTSGPRTSPTPDDLEVWGIVFIVLGIIVGVITIPIWETAMTTAYVLLSIAGALFMAGLVCLFIYDPEGCIESCGEIMVEVLMGIILGLLCGS